MKMSVFCTSLTDQHRVDFFSVGNTRFFKVVTPIKQRKKWIRSWIIERLDRKLADAIGSNTVENVTSHYREPFNLLHSTFCASYVSLHISLSLFSTIRIGHVLK